MVCQLQRNSTQKTMEDSWIREKGNLDAGRKRKKGKRRGSEETRLSVGKLLLTSLQVHCPQTAVGSCQLARLSMDFAGISAPNSASSRTRSNHQRLSRQSTSGSEPMARRECLLQSQNHQEATLTQASRSFSPSIAELQNSLLHASPLFSDSKGLVFKGLSKLARRSRKLVDMRLELRRLPSSNVFDIGERSEEVIAGDATPDESDDAISALEEDAFAFFEPLVRKMANGESVDQRELAVDAERRLG